MLKAARIISCHVDSTLACFPPGIVKAYSSGITSTMQYLSPSARGFRNFKTIELRFLCFVNLPFNEFGGHRFVPLAHHWAIDARGAGVHVGAW